MKVLCMLLARRVMSSSIEAERLAQLWRGATETMIGVPGAGRLILRPDDTAMPWSVPAALAKGKSFALTAFDPPGVSRSRDENREANIQMWQELKEIASRATAYWRGYGCDLSEGWREDGFILNFESDFDRARTDILRVAAKFDQGAIYEYYTQDSILYRRTLPAKFEADIFKDPPTPMVSIPTIDHHPLTELPWAGPSELLMSKSECT